MAGRLHWGLRLNRSVLQQQKVGKNKVLLRTEELASMKILFTNENRNFGGSEKYCLELARELTKAGIEVHFWIEKDSWLDQHCEMPKHYSRFRGEIDPTSYWRLWRLQRQQRYNWIHCHATRDFTAASLFPLDAPIIKHEHCYLGPSLSGWLRRCYQRCHSLVAVSQDLANHIKERTLRPSVQVIHNGLELPKPDVTTTHEGLVVGNVTSFHPGKGQLELWTIVEPLLRQRPDLKLFLGGDGPERALVLQLAQSANLINQVSCPGHQVDPIGAMSGLDVVLLASRQETFSLVCAEAMSLSKPVLAYRCGGIVEVVKDTVTGRLFDNGDANQFRQALGELLDKPKDRQRFGAAGRLRVAQKFCWRQIVSEWKKLYQH
jgi:glycosyltransferase involved in cell wall biosynthesis